MTETNNTGDSKPPSSGRTLSIGKSAEQGRVRQNFAHGRSKSVVVETKRKRVITPPGAKPAVAIPAKPSIVRPAPKPAGPAKPAAAAPAKAPGKPLRALTESEREARERALAGAKEREIRERAQAEVDARAQAEARERQKAEQQAAAALQAEKDATARVEAEARLKSETAPKRNQPAAAESTANTAGPAKGRPREVKRDVAKPAPRPRSDGERRRGKLTIGNALNEGSERSRSLAAFRRRTARQKKQASGFTPTTEKISREVIVPEAITIQELANRMAERAVDVIKLLMKQGDMRKINDVIDADTAQLVAEELGHTVRRVAESDVEEGLGGDVDADEDMVTRPPIVTVMGHVDHGKTSLLDALRKTSVVTGEAGGITQHIGAYQVDAGKGKVTFIDTPGHAAFTAMRARGAKATDIVVLVVAADDGVMPQTIEAINHARAAEVPLIVAINKIDLPGADANRVRTGLLNHEIVVESMGGETLEIEVSAIKGTNLDKLIDAIVLQAELLDLKANPARPGEGMVVEAQLDKGRGPVATVLVQRGTLRLGDIAVAGSAWGRIRALINDRGSNIDEAGPSIPVEVLGLSSAPDAGDALVVVDSDARAREVTEYRTRKRRENRGIATARSSLEQMMSSLKEAGVSEFPVLIKSDVQGSAEAIVQALEKIGNDEVKARIIHYAAGGISESDVQLAAASNAVIIGFNVRANSQARDAASAAGIEIRYYSIIYDLVDDMKAAMSGMLAPELRETFLGNADILEIFNISKVGKIAGCRVSEGNVQRGARVRLLRDSVVIHEGTLSTLKRFKDEVKEVQAGQECGMAFEKYQDMRAGDTIECFTVEEIKRAL